MSGALESDLHPEDHEEPIKPVRQVFEQELLEGLNALYRPLDGLIISAFSGGLDFGFSRF